MGAKSTRTITREDAIERFVSLKALIKDRKWRSQATAMTDTELENALEKMNDAHHDGEGFENYNIGDVPE